VKQITKVGSVSGLRDGISEVKSPPTVRISEKAREQIRKVDDAKADLYQRASTIRMDGSRKAHK